MDEQTGQVVLRHKDANRQALMFGSFAVLILAIPTFNFVTASPARWALLVLVPLGLLVAYFALRLATLRVVLNESGVLEPAPLRPTVLTPWHDVVRVYRMDPPAGARFGFLGVAIEHRDKLHHQVIALNINTRDPLADKMINDWIREIREAKKRYTA